MSTTPTTNTASLNDVARLTDQAATRVLAALMRAFYTAAGVAGLLFMVAWMAESRFDFPGRYLFFVLIPLAIAVSLHADLANRQGSARR